MLFIIPFIGAMIFFFIAKRMYDSKQDLTFAILFVIILGLGSLFFAIASLVDGSY